MVGDSTGTHLKFIDYNNETLSKIVVGRSNAEWSTSNIRIGDSPEVHHTSENVSWQINPLQPIGERLLNLILLTF